MSRDRTIVPTNLLDWPRVCNLLPEVKFILQTLWAFKDLSCVGAGFVAIGPFASTLSLKPEAALSGLKMLVDAQLIMLDEGTSEVFVLDWFRFHQFKNPVALKMFAAAVEKIQSPSIRMAVLEKSKGCLPTSTPTPTSSSTPPPTGGGAGGGSSGKKIKPVFSQEELAEFAESAAWNMLQGGGEVGPNLKAFVTHRIIKDGPTHTDIQQLQAFRSFKEEAETKATADAAAAVWAEAERQEKVHAATERQAALEHFFSLSNGEQDSTKEQFFLHLEENAAMGKDHKVLVPLFKKHGPTANPLVKSEFQNWLVSNR